MAVKHRRGPTEAPSALCGVARWRVLARATEPPTCQRCALLEGSSSRRTVESGAPNVLGYARVSKADQSLAGQVRQLEQHGCGRVYSEHVSSVGVRQQWARLCEDARPGDVVVVVRLDRIGRRMGEVIASVQELAGRGVHVRALAQGIDTSAPGSALLLGVFAALAETEREILRERTREGLQAARASGAAIGRPTVITPALVDQVAHLRARGHSLRAIAKTLHVGASTVSRVLELRPAGDPRQMTLEVQHVRTWRDPDAKIGA